MAKKLTYQKRGSKFRKKNKGSQLHTSEVSKKHDVMSTLMLACSGQEGKGQEKKHGIDVLRKTDYKGVHQYK